MQAFKLNFQKAAIVSLGYPSTSNLINAGFLMNCGRGSQSYPNANGGQIVDRAWMQFDLSSVPINTNIISAILTLYILDNSMGANPYTFRFQRANNSSWNPNTITWNLAPNLDVRFEVEQQISFDSHITNSFIKIDLTDAIRKSLADRYVTFRLRSNTESYVGFTLFDNPLTNLNQYLTINYVDYTKSSFISGID